MATIKLENTNIELQILTTQGISELMKESNFFTYEVVWALDQFKYCDWGDLCEEDKILNDQDLKEQQGHVIGRYYTTKGDIYIETKDYKNVIIMFVEER